jgi:hypothetical protein
MDQANTVGKQFYIVDEVCGLSRLWCRIYPACMGQQCTMYDVRMSIVCNNLVDFNACFAINFYLLFLFLLSVLASLYHQILSSLQVELSCGDKKMHRSSVLIERQSVQIR